MFPSQYPVPKSSTVSVHPGAAEEFHLLQQAAAGESQAFDTLYRRYAPYLRRYLRRRLPSPDLIDDVCNDVFLVAWQRAGCFQATARLSTWLCGIARYRALKAWGRAARLSAADVPLSPSGEAAVDPGLLLLREEKYQGLARAVAQLPADLRVVVEAVYYQAASCEAIAVRLGCPIGTVQTRLFRARRRLRASLVREGHASATP